MIRVAPIVALVIVVTILGCHQNEGVENTAKHKCYTRHIERYADSSLKRVCFVDDADSGKIEGEEVFYMPGTNRVYRSQYYVNGQPEGEMRQYGDSNNIMVRYYMHSGKIDGKVYFYHDNGQIAVLLIVKNGKTIVCQTAKHSNGVSYNPGTFDNGTGVLNWRDDEGKIFQHSEYADGEEIYRVYYSDDGDSTVGIDKRSKK